MTNAGSYWSRWDLHVHTPSSYVQGYGGDDEDTWEQFIRYIPSVPHISEAGMLSLLHDMAEEDPRLVGRTPADYVDMRFVADLEQSGFIPQVLGEAATSTP